MPIPNRFKGIVRDLVAGTEAGRVDWAHASLGESVATSIQGYTLSIQGESPDAGPNRTITAFVLRVMSPRGDDVDQFRIDSGTNDPDFLQMALLWGAAERTVEGTLERQLEPVAAGLRKLAVGV